MMASPIEVPKVSKTLVKTASRYMARLQRGEKIMRDSRGQLQWADGKPLGEKTVRWMLGEGQIAELDTDLFGDRHRGQTLGLPS
jgi:hypothetical protein